MAPDIYADLAAGDADLLRALRSYDAHRGGLPLQGKQDLIRSLQRLPRGDWADILNQSVQRGWKNIYPLKKNSRIVRGNALEDQYRRYGPIGPKIDELKRAMEDWNIE